MDEIAERKRSEEKLLFKNALLEAQSETTIDGILAANENDEIVLCNRRLQEMWRIPVNLLQTGMHELIFRHIASQIEDLLPGESWHQLLKRIEKDRSEVKMKDGRIFDAYSSPLIDANRVLRGRIWYFRDITERKEMEQRLIMTDRLASIGELVSGIAHELNNPLTGVIGYAQLIMEQDIRDDLRDDLTVISSEAQRAARIIKDLLTFARKHSPVKEPGRINSVIDDVLKLRAYEHKTNNIEVIREFEPSLPETMLDYRQIQQVFLNLVINAEFFMIREHKKGRLTIKTERVNGFIRSTITDDGPGITEENLRHIFDPFFTTKEEGKGTGLGLSICHGIVTEHKGRIYARNVAGKGASFIVDIPIIENETQTSKPIPAPQ
jgi:signal transduction histidine kinase